MILGGLKVRPHSPTTIPADAACDGTDNCDLSGGNAGCPEHQEVATQ